MFLIIIFKLFYRYVFMSSKEAPLRLLTSENQFFEKTIKNLVVLKEGVVDYKDCRYIYGKMSKNFILHFDKWIIL